MSTLLIICLFLLAMGMLGVAFYHFVKWVYQLIVILLKIVAGGVLVGLVIYTIILLGKHYSTEPVSPNNSLYNLPLEQVLSKDDLIFVEEAFPINNNFSKTIIKEQNVSAIDKEREEIFAYEMESLITASLLNCEQFQLATPSYIIIESFFGVEENAKKRVAYLQDSGYYEATYIWLPCFVSSKDKALFAVLIGQASESSIDIKEQQTVLTEFALDNNIDFISNVLLFIEGKKREYVYL